MATFPIQYTEATPSGRGQNVPLHLDVSTGAEYIARGMENLGQAFGQVAAAKRSIDFSTRKRKFEELTHAAANVHKTTGDPIARKALEDKWSKDADEALTSDDPVLNQELTKFKNENMPDAGQIFANQNLAFEARQNKDAFETNLQHLKENGAVEEARKQLWNYQRTTNQISEADAAQMDKDMPVDSALERARVAMPTDPNGATQILKGIEKEKLSPDQMRAFSSYLGLARQQAADEAQQFESTMNDEMIKIDQKDPSPLELRNSADALEKTITTSNLTGDHKMKLIKEVRSWQKGEGDIDYDRLNSLNLRIDHIKESGDQDPELVADINRAKLEGAFGRRGKEVAEKYTTMTNRLKTSEHTIYSKVIDDIVKDFNRDKEAWPDTKFIFHRAMDKLIERAQKEDWPTVKLYEEAKTAAAFYRKVSAKEEKIILRQIGSAGETTAKPMPVVRTDEDFKALKSGELFKAPDGTMRRKP